MQKQRKQKPCSSNSSSSINTAIWVWLAVISTVHEAKCRDRRNRTEWGQSQKPGKQGNWSSNLTFWNPWPVFLFLACALHVCVGFGVCSNVSGADTEPARDQPAMTDWWRLPSCAGCSFVVSLCVFFECVSLHIYDSVCIYMCVWWWKTRPGLVWTQGKITVSVHVCVAGPVADVVQTWTSAGDCCLHIYLHDCVCACLYECVRVHVRVRASVYICVCVDWNGDSPKSTS